MLKVIIGFASAFAGAVGTFFAPFKNNSPQKQKIVVEKITGPEITCPLEDIGKCSEEFKEWLIQIAEGLKGEGEREMSFVPHWEPAPPL